jgi:hypothetical protein
MHHVADADSGTTYTGMTTDGMACHLSFKEDALGHAGQQASFNNAL